MKPDPDTLVRGMDPRIQIRIHTKMSWIRNTCLKSLGQVILLFYCFFVPYRYRIVFGTDKIF
jgi:hypothetical protein